MELIEINLWLCVLRAPPWDCSFDVESGLARDASLPTCKNSHRFYGSTKVDLRHLGPSFAHGYQGYLSIHHLECYNYLLTYLLTWKGLSRKCFGSILLVLSLIHPKMFLYKDIQ